MVEINPSVDVLFISRVSPSFCTGFDNAFEKMYSKVKAPDKTNAALTQIPIASDKSAAVTDYARCVVRRLERCAVRCKLDIRYLNRLSDYLFVLSRYLECGDKI